jgi:hypothetical protein
MTIWSSISSSLLHQSIRIIKYCSMRWRNRAWIVIRLQDTLFESILNWKVIISDCCRRFTELLLDVLYPSFAPSIIIDVNCDHLAGILLNSRVLLDIWTCLHYLLMILNLQACFRPITQNGVLIVAIVACRVCISLQERIGYALIVGYFAWIRNYSTWSQVVLEETIIQSVVAKVSWHFITRCRKWII